MHVVLVEQTLADQGGKTAAFLVPIITAALNAGRKPMKAQQLGFHCVGFAGFAGWVICQGSRSTSPGFRHAGAVALSPTFISAGRQEGAVCPTSVVLSPTRELCQ